MPAVNFAFTFPSKDFFAQFSLNHFPPAGLSAGVSIILAFLVLVANHRRPINRMWALGLFFASLWQGGIAISQWLGDLTALRLAVIFGACGNCSAWLLKETVAFPSESFGTHLKRSRLQLALLPLFFLVFTRWWLIPPTNGGKFYAQGPLYWILDGISFLWTLSISIHATYLIRTRKVTGIARSELIALNVLIVLCIGVFIGTSVFGAIFDIRHAGWVASIILVVGLPILTVLLVRNEIFDERDFRKGFVLFFARGIIYFVVGFLAISILSGFSEMGAFARVLSGIALILMLAALPMLDYKLRNLVNRQFVSQDFLDAHAFANGLIEKTQQTSDLHAGYVEVLQRWSGGSPEIFLSQAMFKAPWPLESIPSETLQQLSDRKWATPEILDRQGLNRVELKYLLENNIGAIVCFTAKSGERLIAAFKTRSSERPFVSRELREAHELLRVMQLGLSFAKISRKLLGGERLNFYAQYAPQFAHEMRNGLYLQNQLLRAIAAGRSAEVMPSDAKAGLERIEQVDRLCDHFLNIRNLYDRPIQAIELTGSLTKAIDEVALRHATEAQVVFRTNICTASNVHALGNPDLFTMAVNNLLKNAVEALERVSVPRWIEITASAHLEKIHLLIQDNGPGLPDERLNDPFAPCLSRKQSGMGIGLSITRDCIEAMGGTIGLRSSSPKCACSEITLNCIRT